MAEKLEVERKIINLFIEGYKKRFGVNLVIVDEDRESPDFEIKNLETGKLMGVEITGTYSSDREAKIQYGREPNWDRLTSSGEEVLAKLNCDLCKKTAKSFSYQYNGEMILVVFIGSLIFNQRMDINFIQDKIIVPKSNFSQIWLILQNEDYSGPDLFPLMDEA